MLDRFQRISDSSGTFQKRLGYEELKYRLIAFHVAVEENLKKWSLPFGRQKEVSAIQMEYEVSAFIIITVLCLVQILLDIKSGNTYDSTYIAFVELIGHSLLPVAFQRLNLFTVH